MVAGHLVQRPFSAPVPANAYGSPNRSLYAARRRTIPTSDIWIEVLGYQLHPKRILRCQLHSVSQIVEAAQVAADAEPPQFLVDAESEGFVILGCHIALPSLCFVSAV